MKLRITIFLCLLCLGNAISFALEIDEKLTCRVLRLSSTKKTMLINRGMEDGLVVGDHAKFFITTGVVARGVVLKASPSRTIWAIYRMVNPKEINVDTVINLKITAPVKLTTDSSQAFGADPYSDANAENPAIEDMGNNVDLGGRSEDVPMDLRRTNPHPRDNYSRAGGGRNKSDDDELGDMYEANNRSSRTSNHRSGGGGDIFSDESGVDASKDWEVWSLYDLGILSSDGSKTTTLDLYLGLEKYFNKPSEWFGKVSPIAFIHSNSTSSSSNGESTSDGTFQLGIGAHYNFSNNPFSYNRIIGFVGPTLAYGSAKMSAGTGDEEASGKASTFTLGGGIKYYLPMGLGFRFQINYFSESRSFEFDDGSEKYSYSGIATYAGLSYRF